MLHGSVTARVAAVARAASAALPPFTRIWRPAEDASGCYRISWELNENILHCRMLGS